MLPELPAQTPLDQDIGSVTADWTYETRKCHDAIAVPLRTCRHAAPQERQAMEAYKRRGGSPGVVVNASRDLARALLRRRAGYHRRCRAETKMHKMKLLSQSNMARDFDRQVAEIQVRVAVLDRCKAPRIPVTKQTGSVRPGKGEVRPHTSLCNKAMIEDTV